MLRFSDAEFYILSEAKTSDKFGCAPESRSIDQLLDNGIVILDKPSGPTSHQVDNWLKTMFTSAKTGHSGTLDPKVSGVLPMGINKATRALPILLKSNKAYVCLMQLHGDVSEQAIRAMAAQFTGEIYQKPPVRSAVKRDIRIRTIDALTIHEIDGRNVLFSVDCESGTYIRTLCVDIGRALGCGASMRELRRTRVAHFPEAMAVTLQDVKDAYVFLQENGEEQWLRDVVLPMELTLETVPKIIVKDSVVDALCNGANLALPGIVAVEKTVKKGDFVAIMTLKGEGVAVGTALMSGTTMSGQQSGLVVDTERVLMERGTYPRMWRTGGAQ